MFIVINYDMNYIDTLNSEHSTINLRNRKSPGDLRFLNCLFLRFGSH